MNNSDMDKEIEEILNIKSLDFTCIDTCEGVCKRVLKDIAESGLSKSELTEAYRNDMNHGGRSYDSIIELGELLKVLKGSRGVKSQIQESKYIPLCCPRCGNKIFLCVDNNSKIFKEKYNCTHCGSDLDVKYDIGSRNLNINIELDLE